MLSRRIIRIRAMKSLYSYFINKQTSYDISIEKIKSICTGHDSKIYIELFNNLINNPNIKSDKNKLVKYSEILDLTNIFKKSINQFQKNLYEGLKIQESLILNNYCFIMYILLKWKNIAESRFIKMNKYKTPDSEILNTSNYFKNEILENIQLSEYIKILCN
jgi:hypothetical protein